jgi:hypothetical protein
MLPKNSKRIVVREAAVKSKKYLAFLRTHPCMVCSLEGSTQAHHIRHHEPSATGYRHGDQWAVPLCDKCHNNLHSFGNEEMWWECEGIDPIGFCERSWKNYKGEKE